MRYSITTKMRDAFIFLRTSVCLSYFLFFLFTQVYSLNVQKRYLLLNKKDPINRNNNKNQKKSVKFQIICFNWESGEQANKKIIPKFLFEIVNFQELKEKHIASHKHKIKIKINSVYVCFYITQHGLWAEFGLINPIGFGQHST